MPVGSFTVSEVAPAVMPPEFVMYVPCPDGNGAAAGGEDTTVP